MRGRWYHPLSRRLRPRDPGPVAPPLPGSLDGFSYAGANPIGRLDPTGAADIASDQAAGGNCSFADGCLKPIASVVGPATARTSAAIGPAAFGLQGIESSVGGSLLGGYVSGPFWTGLN